MNKLDYINAHKYCSNHGDMLRKDHVCGCFYCLHIYEPKEIERWSRQKRPIERDTDGQIIKWLYDENETAFCPYCGVDSVIGESSGYHITKEFLEEMHHYWFGKH